jgi:hypothetical protein
MGRQGGTPTASTAGTDCYRLAHTTQARRVGTRRNPLRRERLRGGRGKVATMPAEDFQKLCAKIGRTGSFGQTPRDGIERRKFVARWLGPAIVYPRLVQAMEALKPPTPGPTRRANNLTSA